MAVPVSSPSTAGSTAGTPAGTPTGTGSPGVGVGTGLAITSVASVQLGAALATHLFSRVGPVGTVSLRLAGAAVVLVVLTRPWRRTWTRRDLGTAVLFGGVFTAMNVSLYLALDRLPLATVITLEFLGPLTVSIVLADRRTRVWTVPAAAGVALLGGSLSFHDLAGVGLALLAACCWASYILLSGRIGRSGTGLAGLALAGVVGAVVMVPIGVATAGAALFHPSTTAYGLGIGVLSSAIPYSLDLLALRRLPTAVFGVLTSLNPGVAALAGLVVLGETTTVRALVGIALIMLASAGVSVSNAASASRERRRAALAAEGAVRPG